MKKSLHLVFSGCFNNCPAFQKNPTSSHKITSLALCMAEILDCLVISFRAVTRSSAYQNLCCLIMTLSSCFFIFIMRRYYISFALCMQIIVSSMSFVLEMKEVKTESLL